MVIPPLFHISRFGLHANAQRTHISYAGRSGRSEYVTFMHFKEIDSIHKPGQRCITLNTVTNVKLISLEAHHLRNAHLLQQTYSTGGLRPAWPKFGVSVWLISHVCIVVSF